ncbi:MAG: hypothetical protein ACRC28_17235 [Clostridium sp.]
MKEIASNLLNISLWSRLKRKNKNITEGLLQINKKIFKKLFGNGIK